MSGRLFAPGRGEPSLPDLKGRLDVFSHQEHQQQWTQLRYISNEPLTPEHERFVNSSSFEYNFAVRKGIEKRFIVVCAEGKRPVARFMKVVGLPPMDAFGRLRLDIDNLVQDMASDPPQDYTIGSLYASIDAYGISLRRIALYGDDLADASFVRNILSRMACYRVSFRDASTKDEVLGIGSRGDISFPIQSPKTFHAVDRCLRFLRDRGLFDQ